MSINRCQFATLVLLLSITSTVTSAQERRTVSVTGTVIAHVKPDLLTWSISVTTTDLELQKATSSNEEIVRRLLALREQLNVAADDIQTGYLRIQKVYHQDENRNRGEFRHYSISRSVTIRQTELANFEETLAQLSSMKDISVSHQLSSSRYHEVRRETRLKAIQVAREKAAEMCEALDAKLGSVLTIEEDNGSQARGIASNSMYRSGEAVQEDEIAGTFAPGSLRIRVSVKVSFAIE